jgi:hypothetical protein
LLDLSAQERPPKREFSFAHHPLSHISSWSPDISNRWHDQAGAGLRFCRESGTTNLNPMKRQQHSEEQIIQVLDEAQTGAAMPV